MRENALFWFVEFVVGVSVIKHEHVHAGDGMVPVGHVHGASCRYENRTHPNQFNPSDQFGILI